MIDPRSLPRGGNPEPIDNPVSLRKSAHPWAWIVGLVVTLLLIWGLFGMNHLQLDLDSAEVPAATATK